MNMMSASWQLNDEHYSFCKVWYDARKIVSSYFIIVKILFLSYWIIESENLKIMTYIHLTFWLFFLYLVQMSLFESFQRLL